MADFLTDTEEAIVAALKRLWLTKKYCMAHYDMEETHVVFEQKVGDDVAVKRVMAQNRSTEWRRVRGLDPQVLLSFHEQDTSDLRHPELDAKTKSQILHAIRFLGDARDTDGEPSFKQVNWANGAKIVKASDNARPSKISPGDMVVPKEIFNALVVSLTSLWTLSARYMTSH